MCHHACHMWTVKLGMNFLLDKTWSTSAYCNRFWLWSEDTCWIFLKCRLEAQCFTWWYLPILRWECLRIMPSVGSSYKQKVRKEKNETWQTTGSCCGVTRKRKYLSHQQLQQSGLSCSIGPHQSHSCIQVDTKLQVIVYVRLQGNTDELEKLIHIPVNLAGDAAEYSLCCHCTWSSHSEPW